MGYESKFMICRKSILSPRKIDGDDYYYANVEAMIDMSKIGNGSVNKLREHAPPSYCYVYSPLEGDGDSVLVYKDRYDDPLVMIDPNRLKIAIEEDSTRWDYYMYKPFMGLIDGFFSDEKFFVKNDEKKSDDELIILHYGY